MKKMYILLLFSIFSSSAFATHVKAGEITYAHLTGLTYTIKVTTYTNTDPLTTQADRCYLFVYFGDGDSAEVPRINGPSFLCTTADGEIFDTYSKKNSYETTHTYPGNGLYTITMEDPNRETGICNIPNSVDTQFYIESTLLIDPALTAINSVQFTAIPVFYAYVGVLYTQNVTAVDPDNDTLTYELVSCKAAGGQDITGYSYPAGFSIDSLDGEITWNTPMVICKYNFAVKVTKWRNGNMIGFVIRDFQICSIAFTEIDEHAANSIEILVYPNPATDKIFISTLNDKFRNTYLYIYDLTGRLISGVPLSGTVSEIDITTLPKGFYNYEVRSNKINSARGKLIKN